MDEYKTWQTCTPMSQKNVTPLRWQEYMNGASIFLLWGCFSPSHMVGSFCNVALTCHCRIPFCKIRLAMCATLFNSTVVLHTKFLVGSKAGFSTNRILSSKWLFIFFLLCRCTLQELHQHPFPILFCSCSWQNQWDKNEATLMARDQCEQMVGSCPE